ncbi:daptide biosynthesis RiPP recognition protein [Streptomyces roseolus]|uniref:daptide biosynthesis RiPP recognition protein n=1 Tax=Streptomyces TaxID=1883 RepID=UPI0036F05D7A
MERSRLGGAKRRLASWGTGLTGRTRETADGPATGTVVLESADRLDEVLAADFTGAGTVVLVPGDGGGEAGPDDEGRPLVLAYEGSLAEPGDEMSIGDSFFLQTQDYATSAYMSVIGPTLIRITEAADLDAFLADADKAREHGEFASFATHPSVRLGDLPALGADPSGDGPRARLFVRATGEVTLGPGGLPLGTAGDGLAALEAEWARLNAGSEQPCAVSLGAVVPEPERVAALAARPWLGRYLAALDAIRELRSRGTTGLKVSGFGARLAHGEGDADHAGVDVPLLLWNDDDKAFVHHAPTGRFFAVDRAAAELTEALLVHGSVEAAAAHAGTGADRDALTRVEGFFTTAGVRLTGPAPMAAAR